MSRSTSTALLLIGALLFLGSCAPFVNIVYHEFNLSPVESFSLSTSASPGFASFTATPGKLARFTLETDISTESLQEDPDSIGDDYLARFSFPVSYSIRDINANTLVSKESRLDWKESFSLSKSNEKNTSTEGSLTANLKLEKFVVPADGRVDISIEINPDITYRAIHASPQLHLYEGLIDNTWYLVGGIVMLLVGTILAILGLIFVVISFAQESSQQQIHLQGPNNAVTQPDENIIQQAVVIHLSAFSGYVFPFGSIIVPLILWLCWKDKDPYLDETGREALNFQLTMMIYYLISIFLMIILIGILLIFAAALFHLVFVIIASVHTSRGIHYKYPLTIRFIK